MCIDCRSADPQTKGAEGAQMGAVRALPAWRKSVRILGRCRRSLAATEKAARGEQYAQLPVAT